MFSHSATWLKFLAVLLFVASTVDSQSLGSKGKASLGSVPMDASVKTSQERYVHIILESGNLKVI